jgi:hypothetical protein
MQYPSFPMPCSYPDFPDHSDMAAYLDAYASEFGLREFIRFRASVERLEPDPSGGWWLTLADGSVQKYRSRVASRTFMSVRSGTHVLPRWIGGKSYDARDIAPFNMIPWRLMNLVYRLRVAQELGPAPASWPVAVHRLLEGIPIVSSDLVPAVRGGDVVVKPAIDRLLQDRVHFVDESEEMLDRIIYCTGYRISLPFLSSSLVSATGRDFPLYRRIVPPNVRGLFFAGFVDAPGGLLPVVEAQGEWIAAVVARQLLLPPQERMRQAMERPERRTRQGFPGEGPYGIRCDPHAYRRVLRVDLRRGAATERPGDQAPRSPAKGERTSVLTTGVRWNAATHWRSSTR